MVLFKGKHLRGENLVLLTALTAVTLTSCERRTWTGPLAVAADSVLPTRPVEGCDSATVDMGFGNVKQPLRSCAVVRGDTSFQVMFDSRSRALIVTRAFHVDSARQALVHDSLEFVVGSQYEAAVICPQSDDLASTDVRIWNTLDRQIELRKFGFDQVVLELRTNHPGCHAGG